MVGANLGPSHDLGQRMKRLSQGQTRLDTRDILQNASIGAGGLTVNGGNINVTTGGSIIVTGGGSIQLPTGTFTAAHVVGSTDVTAPTINASNVQLGNNGTVYSLYALNNPVSTGYFALYVNSDGRFGRTPSARKYKQDIANFTPSQQAAFAIQLREFRIRAAVAELGDDAPIEHGLIAEELIDIGLEWLVLFGPDGAPEGIAYEKVALALIPAIQDLESQVREIRDLLRAAGL